MKPKGSDESSESHQHQQQDPGLGRRSPALSVPAETRGSWESPPNPPNYAARLTKWNASEHERTISLGSCLPRGRIRRRRIAQSTPRSSCVWSGFFCRRVPRHFFRVFRVFPVFFFSFYCIALFCLAFDGGTYPYYYYYYYWRIRILGLLVSSNEHVVFSGGKGWSRATILLINQSISYQITKLCSEITSY